MATEIKATLSSDDAFSVKIQMVGINGLLGYKHLHVFDLIVESKTFCIDGVALQLRSSVRGTFQKLCPNTTEMKKLGLTDDVVDQHNADVLNNMFNCSSIFFAFDRDDIHEFFNGEHFIHLVHADGARNKMNSIPKLNEETGEFAKKAFIQFLEKTSQLFEAGSLPETKAFLKLFG